MRYWWRWLSGVPARRTFRVRRVVAAFAIAALPEVGQLEMDGVSLRGLPGVAVVGETTSGDVRRWGLTETWLERIVAGALEEGALPLLTRSDALSSERQPLLVVRLQTVRLPDQLVFAWHLSLNLHQKIGTLGARPDTSLAQTWAASASIGVTSGRGLRESVRQTLDRQIEQFVREWKRSSREP